MDNKYNKLKNVVVCWVIAPCTEDSNLQTHQCENLKSYIINYFQATRNARWVFLTFQPTNMASSPRRIY